MAGSIHKYETKQGTRYFVMLEVGVNGERKQKKKMGFKTKKEARAYLAENQVAINKGLYVEPSNMLYREFIKEWMKAKKLIFSTQTYDVNVRNINNWIIPFLGDYPLSQITPQQLRSYVNELVDSGLAATTIKTIFVQVKSSFSYAVDMEYIYRNPASKVVLPKVDKQEEEVWSEEEAITFLRAAKNQRFNPSFYIAYYIAYYSGARQGEVLGLPWKNVDFDNNTITINQTLHTNGKEILKTTKTQTSKRTISMPPFVMDELKLHKQKIEEDKKRLGKGYIDNDLVCCTKLGTPIQPTTVRKRMKTIIEKCGVKPIKFHCIRHTHASILLDKGVNVKIISTRLGHKDIMTTLNIYSHLLEKSEATAIDSLADIKSANKNNPPK